MGIDAGAKVSSMATINVVPLIDILLVLVIIFYGDHTARAWASKRFCMVVISSGL